MSAPRQREYTFVEAFAFMVGMIGIQIGSEVIPAWGTDYYSPAEGLGRAVYVPIGLVFVIFATAALIAILIATRVSPWPAAERDD